MKMLRSTATGFALLLLGATQASAVSLSLLPASQTAMPGDTVFLDLVIDGLGNFAPDSLGTFDIDVGFDSAALSFVGYTLGSSLGDLGLGEAIDLSLGDLGGGLVNLLELSLLDADSMSGPAGFGPFLDDIQAGSFSLAQLEFTVDVLPVGSSTTVDIDTVWAIGDGFGLPLTLDATSPAVIRNPAAAIPEPSTWLLMGFGLVAIAVGRGRGLARVRG